MLVRIYRYLQKYRLTEYIGIGIGWTHIGLEEDDVLELVWGPDLESEDPRVEGQLGLDVLCFLGGLHSLVLPISLLVNVVLDNVVTGDDSWHVLSVLLRLGSLVNLVNFVHDSSLLSSCF